MTALIHLNGPPGIGKSTLAALWAERHPGVLNLDIDALHPMVGGWEDEDNHTHEVLRPVALAMAGTHLAGGRDVVLPQFLARLDEIEAFEEVAHEQGAQFIEIVLMAEKDEAISRFDRRVDRSVWDRHNRRLVADRGGAELLAGMFDALMGVVKVRPSAIVLASEFGGVEETYAQLVQAVPAVGKHLPMPDRNGCHEVRPVKSAGEEITGGRRSR